MKSSVSPAKRAANQANSAASTGPRSRQGKDASKYNRLSHGLASPLAVLPFENQEEYDKLLSACLEDSHPQSATEEALVKQMADAQWKLRRLEKLENSVFSAMMAQSQNEANDPFDAIAAGLLAPGKSQSALGLLARYQATLNRQFLTALKELRLVQQQREKKELKEAEDAALRYLMAPVPLRPFAPVPLPPLPDARSQSPHDLAASSPFPVVPRHTEPGCERV